MRSGGPKPTPTALKILHGNAGKRPLPVGEPQPERTLPEPPPGLGPVGVQEWERLAPELHRIGVLTMADRATLGAYCKFYERWTAAEAKVNEDGLTAETPHGFVTQSVYVGMANRAAELMLKYMVELGLTPSSRVKLAKGGKSEEIDALEAFLQKKKRK